MFSAKLPGQPSKFPIGKGKMCIATSRILLGNYLPAITGWSIISFFFFFLFSFPYFLHGFHLFCGWWKHLQTDPSTENAVPVSGLLHEKYAQDLPFERKWACNFSNIQAWGPTAESASQICCLLLLHSWVSTLHAPASDFISPPHTHTLY